MQNLGYREIPRDRVDRVQNGASTLYLEVQHMAIRMTRSTGMLLLAIWLILTGVAGLAPLPIPGIVMAVLALIAGVLILVGQ
jgi:hypothetical protein